MNKSKFIPLILIAIVFMAGCSSQVAENNSADVTAPSETKSKAESVSMEDLPCHKMPDGSLMGDCPVDEFGNPYIPKESNGDHHDDSDAEEHLHQDDHEHADDVPPHRH